jgi:hypothetical protein
MMKITKLLILVYSLSMACSFAEKCDPHGISENDAVKAGPPIEVRVYVTVNGNKYQINPGSGYMTLEGGCAGSPVVFSVEAVDNDEHVCQKDGVTI